MGLEGTFKIGDCEKEVSKDKKWWHAFTLDGKTNKLEWKCSSGEEAPETWAEEKKRLEAEEKARLERLRKEAEEAARKKREAEALARHLQKEAEEKARKE